MDRNRILPEKIEDALSKAKKAFSELADSVQFPNNDNTEEHILAALIKTLLAPEREINSTDVENFRMVWGKSFSSKDVDRIVAELYDSSNITVEEAAGALKNFSSLNQELLFSNFAELLSSSDDQGNAELFLFALAEATDFATDKLKNIILQAKQKSAKHKKLLSSGAGILATLVILLIFVLTATWLKSVIFGLILAALMFPAEQYFEHRLKQKKGIAYYFFNACEKFTDFIKGIFTSAKFRPTAAEKKKKQNELRIRHAVSLSCILLAFIVISISSFFWILSAGYFSSARQAVRDFMTPSPVENTDPAASENEKHISHITYKIQLFLEENRQKFEANPVIKNLLAEASKILKHPDTQQQLMEMIVKKTGGILNFTTNILGALAVFLLDLLLTIFFFLLFLTQMAQFAERSRNKKQNYIVRSIFSGNWLPRTSEESIEETERIINEILHKLKVWLRGYLSLMFIDFTVYTVVFYFLDVPYFLLLGMIAGCGILLPFIGPILSACITCIVTIACGDATAFQLAGIIIIYLLHNGITEQFILYPSVIGESLGLTTLETIIVVLLGGMFAGATGMIFSIPTAAVIKYLVPRIYQYWNPAKKRTE